jgi:uncharacterized protein (TIGR03435 family)
VNVKPEEPRHRLRHIFCILLAAVALPAQTFESVSVKLFVPQDDDSPPARESGSIVYGNVSLKLLLTAAYGVRPDQISGPAWLDSERYDIVAKPPADATKDQVPVMFQHMLSDRFHLIVRTEERARPGFALVAAKDGPKLNRTKAITGVDFRVSADHIDITGANLPAFAGMLASFMGKPVSDQTGIAGSYDFRLNLTMADLKAAAPAVFATLQELGLALEARNTTTTYLIVDR